jgi:hypothetical protein
MRAVAPDDLRFRIFPSMWGPHFCAMKITEVVRKYAAEQNLADDEALKCTMEEKAAEFAEKGSQVYAGLERPVSPAIWRTIRADYRKNVSNFR